MRPLITLGGLSLPGSDFHRPKLLLLLAYVALEGPSSRRRLQALFWPDERGAAVSLRVGLHQLRRVDADLVTGAEVLTVRVDCDAIRVLQGDGSSQELFRHYTGPFLHGVSVEGISAELGEWIDLTRDRLALSAQLAGLAAAEAALTPVLATRLAAEVYYLVGATPLDPLDLRRLRELSTPGSSLERALLNELEDFDSDDAHTLGSAAPGTVSVGGLLGRGYETGVLLARLREGASRSSNPESRLTEVTGPGGIGKTALVDAVLREHASLSGVQIASIDVEALGDTASVASALAQILEVDLQDQGDAWLALGRGLAQRQAVLGLHGAEHLPELTTGVMTLLEQAPTVHLMLTSRVRITDGTHLRLGSLPLPPAGADRTLLRTSPAVQLFVRAAERAGGNIELDHDLVALLGAIVRRLDGYPLALGLAGGWTRSRSLSQIHDLLLSRDSDRERESVQDLDSSQDLAEVDFSPLKGVFERSWSLLSVTERQALSRLSVFADFTPSDALTAMSVDEAMLTRLEAHSLLRRRAKRLQVFPILAQQMVVESGVLDAARAAHARHYLRQLLKGTIAPADLPNVHLAAHHALASGQFSDAINDALLALHDRGGLQSAGSELFARLSVRAAEVDHLPLVQAGLLIAQGWLSLRAARALDADRLAGRALKRLELVDGLPVPVLRMKALNVRAAALNALGRTPEAIPLLFEATELARQVGDDIREARYLANLGTLTGDVGDFVQAEELLVRAVELHAVGGRVEYELMDRLQLLNLRVEGQLIPSASLLPEAAELVSRLSELGAQQETCRAKITQARLSLQQDYVHAKRLAEETRAYCRAHLFPVLEAAAALVQAEALYALGHSREARYAALRALDLSLAHHDVPGQFETWLVVAADMAATQPSVLGMAMKALKASTLASASQQQRATHLMSERILMLDEVIEETETLSRMIKQALRA